MKMNNPAIDAPKWSAKQRAMFEALISDYALNVYNNRVKPVEIRKRIKKAYDIESTYELTQEQQQEIINLLVESIKKVNPQFELQLAN